MKFALLMTSLFSTVAFAAPLPQAPQVARSPQAPQAAVRFNMNAAKPASSFTLIPMIAYGSAGFNRYEVSKDASVNLDTGSAPNYEAGVLAEFGRGTFVFQTGLMFINTNMNLTSSTSSFGTSARATLEGSLSYLAVPIALKARFRLTEGVRFTTRIGVMPAALTSTKMTISATTTNSNGFTRSSSQSTDTADVRKGQVFAFVGAGPEFRIGRNQNIRLEANLEQMLYNLSYSDATVMMRSLNAMLSYGVGF